MRRLRPGFFTPTAWLSGIIRAITGRNPTKRACSQSSLRDPAEQADANEKEIMNYFHYQDEALLCEEVPVAEIAAQVGTPFYLYSCRTLRHHFRVFDSAFAEVPHIVCFAVKANSNTAILRTFVREGGGVD